MKTILLATNHPLVEAMIRTVLPAGDFEIETVDTAKGALGFSKDKKFDVIIVTELLFDDWEQAVRSLDEAELARLIVFRVGLDETTKPFNVRPAPVFASVHGRTDQDDHNSLKSKLAELLAK